MIEWKKEFETGLASVDHEHQTLIALINQTITKLTTLDAGDGSSRDLIAQQLGDIVSVTSAHFALEENEMRKRNYPELDLHKQDHEALIDSLLDMILDVEKGATDDLTQSLQLRLTDWFSGHFRAFDAKLHRFLDTGQYDPPSTS